MTDGNSNANAIKAMADDDEPDDWFAIPARSPLAIRQLTFG